LPLACTLASLLIIGVVALAVGCVESLMARLRLRFVPHYLVLASAVGAMSLVAAGWLARS
jgi:formate hydrogenlyase subunit 4